MKKWARTHTHTYYYYDQYDLNLRTSAAGSKAANTTGSGYGCLRSDARVDRCVICLRQRVGIFIVPLNGYSNVM
jgi:hypothetical protein